MLSIAQEKSYSFNDHVRSRLGRGDAVLLDSTVPFQLRADELAHHRVLTLPRAAVTRVMPVDRERIGCRIGADNPMLAVLEAAIREIHAGEDPVSTRACCPTSATPCGSWSSPCCARRSTPTRRR